MLPQLSKLVPIRDAHAYPKQAARTVLGVTHFPLASGRVREFPQAVRRGLASTKALPAESLGLSVAARSWSRKAPLRCSAKAYSFRVVGA